ncbi:hypothetical protein AB0H51_27950 [Streptomyces griseoluteus]|uniref:hypothetical protein n=1 Tax=Streptomyces griseoluteus TaxID=29306 RepID=UPI0033C87C76
MTTTLTLDPNDLNGLDAALAALDDDVLIRLHQVTASLMEAREEAALPAAVLESVRETLAEDGITLEPKSVEFFTTEWENGFFWCDSEATVTFADGSTTTVDLDGTEAEDALTDHASWQDRLTGSDRLTVTFDPPAALMA